MRVLAFATLPVVWTFASFWIACVDDSASVPPTPSALGRDAGSQDAGNAIGDAGSDGPFDASADSPPPHTKCDPSSPFTSVAPVAGGINTPRNEISVDLSSDELTMYVSVGDGDANFQIARATRTSVSSPWSAATPLGTSINAAGVQTADPTLSADGLTMYFSSFVAATPAHTFDIYAAVRATPVQEFASPQLIGVLQSDFNESRPRLRHDGKELCFHSTRSGSFDIYCSVISSGLVQAPKRIDAIATPATQGCPVLSNDGLTLYFCDSRDEPAQDIWMTTRATLSDPWRAPVPLPGVINTPGSLEQPAWISEDQCTMYITKSVGSPSNFDIWLATRQP